MKVTSFKSKYLKEFTEQQKLKKLEKKFLFLIFVLSMIRYYQMIINKEVSITEVLPLITAYNNHRRIYNNNVNVD
jgi:hypothetical protein